MKICIDAGHNNKSYDTGAIGNGYKEQDITFEIGARLAYLLWQNGFEVKETRPNKAINLGTNVNSGIQERAKISDDFNSDLFISIHCNSAISKSANGIETLVYKSGGKAETLANCVQASLVKDLKLTNRGIKPKNIGVLRLTKATAILVECGFIGNGKDIKAIIQYDLVAKSIFNGILEYLGDKQMTNKEKAIEIIKSKMDTPQVWIDRLDTIPYFAEFIIKLNKE